MRKAFTLTEMLIGMTIMALVVLGSMNLLAGGLRSLQRTTNDATMTDQGARAMRKISETLRQAVVVTVSNNGRTLTYNLPALSVATDPVTGEREVAMPVVSDGVARSFNVDFGAGTLTENPGGRVLMRNVASTDPDATSTLFNQSYLPFQITSVGTRKALTINIIARDATSGQARTVRMKSTTILRNVP